MEDKILINVYSKDDLKSMECTDELINKVFSLPTDVYYEICEDYQGGNFGMGRIMSLRDWVCQAIEWLFCNESDVNQDWLMYDDYENIIEAIEDFWEIKFSEFSADTDVFVDSLIGKRYKDIKEIEGDIASIFNVDSVSIHKDSFTNKKENTETDYSLLCEFSKYSSDYALRIWFLYTRNNYYYITKIVCRDLNFVI